MEGMESPEILLYLSQNSRYLTYMLLWGINQFGQPQVKKKHTASVTFNYCCSVSNCFLLTVSLALPYSSLGQQLQKYIDVEKSLSV